eukprot:1874802-Prymnesium_polylepis.1
MVYLPRVKQRESEHTAEVGQSWPLVVRITVGLQRAWHRLVDRVVDMDGVWEVLEEVEAGELDVDDKEAAERAVPLLTSTSRITAVRTRPGHRHADGLNTTAEGAQWVNENVSLLLPALGCAHLARASVPRNRRSGPQLSHLPCARLGARRPMPSHEDDVLHRPAPPRPLWVGRVKHCLCAYVPRSSAQ